MHLTFFDNINIVILLLSFALGIFKGLIYTLLDLMLFVVKVLLTLWLLPYSYELLHEYVNNSLAVNILGLIICYIFSIICVSLLSKNVKNLLSPLTGGILDRSFGGLAGIIRAILFINMIFIFSTIGNDRKNFAENSLKKIFVEQYKNNAKWLVNSYSFNMVNSLTKAMIYIIPTSIQSTRFSDFDIYKAIFGNDKEDGEKLDEDLDNVYIDPTEELNKALNILNLTIQPKEGGEK